MHVYWTHAANRDLHSIEEYISQSDPLAAIDQVMDIIDSTEALLTDNPRSGKQGLVDGTYEYVLSKNYYVVYQLDTDQLSILRVLHSRRQWPPVE